MTTNAIDAEIGVRIRAARHQSAMSMQTLADKLGITYQQVQKYELGANRTAASMLWRIAVALEIDFATLMPETMPASRPPALESDASIIRALLRIAKPQVRSNLAELILQVEKSVI